MNTSLVIPTPQRRRTRLACHACKVRKRKCDGNEPCDSCSRYDYRCFYESQPRKKPVRRTARSPTTAASPAVPTSGAATGTGPTEALSQEIPPKKSIPSPGDRYMEANSGVAFPHVLGLDLSTQKLQQQGLGWNLGIRGNPQRSEKSIVWIMSRDEWRRFFDVFVEKIHPVYDLLDLQDMVAKAARRWEDPCATNVYDASLCGVAALGSLFSPPQEQTVGGNAMTEQQERHLVECARDILETTSTIANPTLADAEAWVLRTLYLRCNSTPHAAWVASCTTMHIVEAIGLHHQGEATPGAGAAALWLGYPPTSVSAGPDAAPRTRRLFWIAKLLNTWISFEYGRSRVILQGETLCDYTPPNKPTSPSTSKTVAGATNDLLHLFRISSPLDPSSPTPVDRTTLESMLQQLSTYTFPSDAVTLSQTILAFTIYRRLRLLSSPAGISPTVLNEVLTLGRNGLQACTRCISTHCPWWHVTYVPFQFVCVVLAMDTREGLEVVRDALNVLRSAAQVFGGVKPARAYEAAERLVRRFKRRKEGDMQVLGRALGLGDIQREEYAGTDASSGTGFVPRHDTGGTCDGSQSDYAWFDTVLTAQSDSTLSGDWDALMRDPLDFSSMFLRLGG
ncbi:RDR1-like protein [Aspergillus ustus]|uniref:RDR1-like protein n=1 Tax=Aspergillus ustus TaxID=40382 RepID=A0A0C1C4B9_ASPUT|nr:RDR1-like protein [Aspergillus ustus]